MKKEGKLKQIDNKKILSEYRKSRLKIKAVIDRAGELCRIE